MMIGGLCPYADMRPTGLEWLPGLPAKWELHRGKYSFREVDERSVTGIEELLSVSHKTGVTLRSEKNVTMFMAESYVGHKICRPGDIAVNTMWAWMAALGVSGQMGIVSPSYGVYRPRPTSQFEPKFLDYLLRTETYRAEYVRSSRGITTSRLRLYPPDFLRIPFVQPPRDEQRLIVRFLDWHGIQTAELLRSKRRLIRLLNEQKQTIIHYAITGGLHPGAKRKPSGISWLGEIPEGWELKKLKHLTRFHNGLAFKPSDWKRSGTPIIRIQNLNGSDDFNFTDATKLPTRFLIRPGDLLFAWSGNRGTSFGSFIWDREFNAYLNQHIFKLENYSLQKKYFSYLLRAVTKHVEDETHGIIGLVHITKPELGSVAVPVAPEAEQEGIANWITNQTATSAAAIRLTEREIAALQEFRARLIFDVVTGKLDVRKAAVSLPEQVAAGPEILEPEDVADEFEESESEGFEPGKVAAA
jgi:type I restriction enzyme S subunit